ncbi:MAG: hypothetical protein JRN15_10150 [Nitrososphaerota archaeon]|nr:hypothetical protein [Nitrososphaerota archaeon]
MFDFILVLRIALVPILILVASITSDKWGPGVSGWFVSLPLTSGPVVFLLALSQSSSFASSAAVGVLLGLAAVSLFALTYCLASLRRANREWYVSMPLGWIVFFILGFVLQLFSLSTLLSFFLVIFMLIVIVRVISVILKRRSSSESQLHSQTIRTSKMEILIRILAATVLVFGITQTAPSLGSQLSGVLATFPTYISVLAASVHQSRGAIPAIRLVRGAMYGLFTPSVFFLIIGLTLLPLGTGYSFGLAILVSLVVHGLSLRLVRA